MAKATQRRTRVIRRNHRRTKIVKTKTVRRKKK